MTNQQIANQLTASIPNLWKLLNKSKSSTISSCLKRDYKKATQLLFSNLKGTVDKTSPKAKCYVTDRTYYNDHTKTCVLCAFDHKLNPYEVACINMRQSYYDDLTDDLNASNQSVEDKALAMIFLLKYISLDLTGKTKRHIYMSDNVAQSADRFFNSPRNNNKYLILRSRVMSEPSVASLKNVDTKLASKENQKYKPSIDMRTYCVITYIPQSKVDSLFIGLTERAWNILGFYTKAQNDPITLATTHNADGTLRVMVNSNPYPDDDNLYKDTAFIGIIINIPSFKLHSIGGTGQDVAKYKNYLTNILRTLSKSSFEDYDRTQLRWAIFLGYRFQIDNKAKSGMIGGNKYTMALVQFGINQACHQLEKQIGRSATNVIVTYLKSSAQNMGVDVF